MLAARMGIGPPQLDGSASKAIERRPGRGNLRQMRTVLSARACRTPLDQPVSRGEIEAQLHRFPFAVSAIGDDTQRKLRPLLDQLLEEGGFSLSELERSAYQAAVDRARGNLSAAARLLGLTRAQLEEFRAPAGVRKSPRKEPAGHSRWLWGFRFAADVGDGATAAGKRGDGCGQAASLRIRAVLSARRAARSRPCRRR